MVPLFLYFCSTCTIILLCVHVHAHYIAQHSMVPQYCTLCSTCACVHVRCILHSRVSQLLYFMQYMCMCTYIINSVGLHILHSMPPPPIIVFYVVNVYVYMYNVHYNIQLVFIFCRSNGEYREALVKAKQSKQRQEVSQTLQLSCCIVPEVILPYKVCMIQH